MFLWLIWIRGHIQRLVKPSECWISTWKCPEIPPKILFFFGSRIHIDGLIFSLSTPLSPFWETWYPIWKTGNPICETGYPIWKTGYPIQETGYPFQESGCPTWETQYLFQDTSDDRFSISGDFVLESARPLSPPPGPTATPLSLSSSSLLSDSRKLKLF